MEENGGTGLGSLIVIVGAVLLVLYLSYLFSKYLSLRSSKLGNRAEYMELVDRMAVGQDRYLLIAEVAGRYYLLSSSPHEVRLLRELRDFVPRPAPPAAGPVGESFMTLLRGMAEKRRP